MTDPTYPDETPVVDPDAPDGPVDPDAPDQTPDTSSEDTPDVDPESWTGITQGTPETTEEETPE